MQEAAKARPAATRWRFCKAVIGKARKKSPDRNATFQASQTQSRALVNSEAECQVAIAFARQEQLVGIGELRRITIRRTDAQRHERAGFKCDATDFTGHDRASVAQLVR